MGVGAIQEVDAEKNPLPAVLAREYVRIGSKDSRHRPDSSFNSIASVCSSLGARRQDVPIDPAFSWYNNRMHIDPRLGDIDDCLYRVAIRALIIQSDKVLLVQEAEHWWAFPGGGVDHGETIEATLMRELEEELGVPAAEVSSDHQIAYYNLGRVVNAIPRMNLFFKVSLPEKLLKPTTHVARWSWFTKPEFMKLDLGPAPDDRAKLAEVMFGD
jgi:8-oxo-dGTP pyrophosphatase MutT (NUDIX family)